MGKHNEKEYVKLRLALAEEKIRSAEILFQNNSFRDAISMAYYAIYYAAKAFLLYHGQDPYTHKGVSIVFHKFCAEHKKPAKSFAKMLSIMQGARLDADYKEKVHISKENVCDALDMAKSFLKEIKILIKNP